MDAVTYPNTKVRSELESWVFRKIDVTEEKATATAFGVKAIPVAIAVRGDGLVLGRIPSFVEPGAFRAALREARGAE